MATYAQWRASVDAGEVRRCTWVCGDQRVLVDEVVATIRAALAVSDLDFIVVSAAETVAGDIWAATMQHPLKPGADRLVVIRDAESLTRWDPLRIWFDHTRQLPGVYLLFVSGEPDVPTVKTGGKAKPAPHIELLQARRQGQVVRCAMPNDEDALTWARRRAGTLDQEMAHHLLRRVGGNLAAAADVCDKLALFDGNPSAATIDALTGERPDESFVDALLAGHKRQALLVVQTMSDRDRGLALARLADRVDILARLWRLTRAAQSAKEIHGLPQFLVRQYLPYAKDYDPKRCAYSRRVLAVVTDVYRNGARDAVLEALVALW